MLTHLRPAMLVLTAIGFFVLLGLALPAGRDRHQARPSSPGQANGSLVRRNESTLVGQSSDQPPLVRGRAGCRPNPMATGGTNLGPSARRKLVKTVRQQIARRSRRDGITPTSDLVTTSGSGVRPDIAPVDACAQVNAVSKARGLLVAEVRQLVAAQVQQPQLGFLGSAYINVLQLNEAFAAVAMKQVDWPRNGFPFPGSASWHGGHVHRRCQTAGQGRRSGGHPRSRRRVPRRHPDVPLRPGRRHRPDRPAVPRPGGRGRPRAGETLPRRRHGSRPRRSRRALESEVLARAARPGRRLPAPAVRSRHAAGQDQPLTSRA